jgi:hypothetical protein
VPYAFTSQAPEMPRLLSGKAPAGLGLSCPSHGPSGLGKSMTAAVADVRPSPIAGRRYPREPGRLARSVDAYLDSANLGDLGGTVVAAVPRDRAGLLVASADLSRYCAQDVAERLAAEMLKRVAPPEP